MPYFAVMCFFRSRFLALRRASAFVALLAMLVPLGTSFVHHPDMAQSLAPSMVHMCGMDQSMSDRMGDPTEKAPIHKPSCPICQTMHLLGAGFVSPDVPLGAIFSFMPGTYISVQTAFLFKPTMRHQAQPRAPPILT